jgi:ribose transport system permease protein
MAFIFSLQPRSMSYAGLRLLLNFSMPLVFAGLAQMCVILLGDIDLGIGPFVGLVTCITAAWLSSDPLLAAGTLALCILLYAAMGALVEWRALPSIVVTLGASFVWLGLAVLIMPRPGGSAPAWLADFARGRPPAVPMPILVALAAALVGHVLLRSSYGVALRGAGASPLAVRRAGWSLVRIRMWLYGAAGLFGTLAGLLLAGLNTTGDPNIGSQYTLLSIAAVILGGGQFSGGIVSAWGTVAGAVIMLLTGALLSFLNVSTDWQLSVQGAILIAVLAARGIVREGGSGP